MIAELIDNECNEKKDLVNVTHTKAHFYPIQLLMKETISDGKRHEGGIRT
jgi:hypothetical protein